MFWVFLFSINILLSFKQQLRKGLHGAGCISEVMRLTTAKYVVNSKHKYIAESDIKGLHTKIIFWCALQHYKAEHKCNFMHDYNTNEKLISW